MKVRLSPTAIAYFRSELNYLRQRSPAAAVRFHRLIKTAQSNLARYDKLGFEAEDMLVKGARRLIVGDYILEYYIAAEEIRIASIRSGRQLGEEKTTDPDVDYED